MTVDNASVLYTIQNSLPRLSIHTQWYVFKKIPLITMVSQMFMQLFSKDFKII